MSPEYQLATTKARNVFEAIIADSRNMAIDPTCYVPLTRIREVSDCGMKRLASMFNGDAPSIGMSKGHSSSGAMPIVVKLTAEDKDIVVT